MIINNQYLTKENEALLSMIEQELPHGSGFDGEWKMKMTRPSKINAIGEYHCMNENGYYDGWVFFTVHIDLAKKGFRLSFFSNSRNRYKAEKYFLRDYFEDTIHYSLEKAIGI